MLLGQKPDKVVGRRGEKYTYVATSGDKSQITDLACTNAAGFAMPRFVIFGLNPAWTVGEVPGTMYGLTEKGWIDTSTFEAWFIGHFLVYAPTARPLLLLLDGHSSHYGPAAIRMASELDVIIFCLPPNTTHLLQPLDRSAFGFSAPGVCPFDRSAVRPPISTNREATTRPFLGTASLSFVPMVNPARQQKKANADCLFFGTILFPRGHPKGRSPTSDTNFHES